MLRRFVTNSNRALSRRGMAPSLSVARRWQSAQLSNEEIVSRSQWKSKDLYKRLGLPQNTTDPEQIKRHYHVLAGHFHPDSATGSAEAFVEIKDAFEKLSTKQQGPQAEHDFSRSWRPRDEKARGDMSRVYGDGVPLFLAGCLVVLLVMYFHNKHRLGYGYMSHLFGILLILQLFPRIFAAVIVFGWQCHYLLKLKESTAQHRSVVQLERNETQKTVTITVVGINENDQKQCILEATVEDRSKENEISHRTIVSTKGGQLSVVVDGTNRGASCHVKVTQDDTKLLLTDTVLTL